MSSGIPPHFHPGVPFQIKQGTKRRRVNVACSPCRNHKIRCDGIRPHCGTCRRRREKCVYAEDSNEGVSSHPSSQIDNKMDAMHPLPASELDEPTQLGDQASPEVTAMGLATRPLSDVEDTDESVKGFFGDSSAVAFIKRLQETLKSGTPAPGLPHPPFNSTAFGSYRGANTAGVAQCFKIPRDQLPPRALADHLVDCYFSRIHSLYPFIHKEAFLSCYTLVWTSNGSQVDVSTNPYLNAGLGLGDLGVSTTTFYYGLNIVFAMGCQFSDLVQAERETTSEAFFHRCKRALDVEYLERGDLALVQVLLLTAHYLQGSQTPNRCWHAIGTACRLAQGVGLHSLRGDEHRSFAQKQMRRRIWHGCRMLDLAISSMLGRPPMTSSSLSVPLPNAVDDCHLSGNTTEGSQPPDSFSRVEWFVATLRLHELLREINNTLYDDVADDLAAQKKIDKVQQIQHITQIDSKLEDFRRSLPRQLCWEIASQTNDPDPLLREKLLLKARFLLLRLLAYRPVLSQSLGHIRNAKASDSGIYSNFTQNCSVLCAQASVDLIALVNQTCNTDLASVWFYSVFYVFTAGLVLILTEFDSDLVNIVTREALDLAWDNCSSALDFLKTYSVVAEQCANGLIATRSKCLKLQTDRSHEPQPTAGVQKGSVPNVATGDGIDDALYPEDFLDDLYLDNIPLDLSWFDVGY
ncbi:fungal-specific transcription factor domain-containing protein [Aspergillus carlsbadensis]|nr:fungal-specific transcription factor domain-containing protein [Aspergillus carlsbadensis]